MKTEMQKLSEYFNGKWPSRVSIAQAIEIDYCLSLCGGMLISANHKTITKSEFESFVASQLEIGK